MRAVRDWPIISELISHRRALLPFLIAVGIFALLNSVNVPVEIAIAPLVYLILRQLWLEVTWVCHHFGIAR